jgi:hypothetical protein
LPPFEISKNSSAGDFLACCLRDEGRASKSSRRSGSVDLINKTLIERDVYPHGPACIGKQGNGEQHRPLLDGRSDILVAENVVCAASQREVPSCAFKSFRMLAKGSRRIGNSFFQGISCRKASFDVRKPDAERAIGFFFNDRHVLGRHLFAAFSWSPAGQLVDPAHQTCRQILLWVRHGDDRLSFRMLERVVIAADPIKNPSVPFQHRDQLAAVSFHRSPQSYFEAVAAGLHAFSRYRSRRE